MIEPAFGIIKEQLRGRRFLLRGLDNVRAEFTMLATAFNLRVLWWVRASGQSPRPLNASPLTLQTLCPSPAPALCQLPNAAQGYSYQQLTGASDISARPETGSRVELPVQSDFFSALEGN